MREAALSTGQGQGSATTLQGRPDAIDTSQLSKGAENVRQSFKEGLREKALAEEKARKEKNKALEKVAEQKAATRWGQDKANALVDELVGEADKLNQEEFSQKLRQTQRDIQDVILEEGAAMRLAEEAAKAGQGVFNEELGIYSNPTVHFIKTLDSGEYEGSPLDLLKSIEDRVEFDSKAITQAVQAGSNWLSANGIEDVTINPDRFGKLRVTNLESLSEDKQKAFVAAIKPSLENNAAAVLYQELSQKGETASPFRTKFLTNFKARNPQGQEVEYATFDEYLDDYTEKFLPQRQKESVTSAPSGGSGSGATKDVEIVMQKRPMATESGTYGEKEVMTANIRATSTTTSDGKQGKARSVYVDEDGNRMVNITVNKPNGKQEVIPTPYDDVSGDLKGVEAAFEALEKISADERVKIIGLSEEEAANIDADLIDLDEGYSDDPEKIKTFADKYLKGTGIKAKEPKGSNPNDITLVFPDGEEKAFNTSDKKKRLEIIKAINEAKKGGAKEETKEPPIAPKGLPSNAKEVSIDDI